MTEASDSQPPDCEKLEALVEIELVLRVNPDATQTVVLLVANDNDEPVWIPHAPVPAYRASSDGSVLLSFGYFDDIYGHWRAQYMLPELARIEPGGRYEHELTHPPLLDKLLADGARAQVRARVCNRSFPTSKVRNRQPLDEYLRASCVVISALVELGAREQEPPG